MSNNAASIMTSGLRSSERTKFLHIVMSYDSVEGKYSYQTLDNPALRHRPCSATCDFNDTLRAWQALPRSVQQAASRWVDDNFSDRIWNLHAALPIQKDIRTTRKLLQKAVLGAVSHQDMASIMLVFSSTENYVTSETGSATVAGDSMSELSHTHAPMSDGGASRVELSQTDMEQMREWLTAKGLSTAKIAELESLVVRQKESAAPAAATQSSIPTYEQRPRQDDSAGNDTIGDTTDVDVSRQESGGHVRFVTGDLAPSVRHKSNTKTTVSRVSIPYYRRVGEPYSHQNEPHRTSRMHDGFRQDYRDDSLPPPNSPYKAGRRRPNYHYLFDDDGPDVPRRRRIPNDLSDDDLYDTPRRRSSRRIDDEGYRVDSLQSAYDRRDPREPNRTRTEDEREHRDRRPQTHRQHSQGYSTSQDPSSYGYRDREYGVRTRTTDYPTPIVNVYHDVYQDPGRNPFSPPASSRPVPSDYRDNRSRDHRSRLGDELAEELAELRMERRERERDRDNSDTSSRSRGRHRSGERHELSGDYLRKKGAERSRDNDNARVEVEVRRETSPRPYRIIERERPMPAHQAGHEIFVRPYNDYGRRQRSYPMSTQIPPFVDPDILSIPRQLSPGPILDDASDAEDAVLDDAELKNKMLVKYTGGTVANIPTVTDRASDQPHSIDAGDASKVAEENAADPGAELDDEDIRWSLAVAIKNTRDRKKGAKLDLEPELGLPVDESASPDSQTVDPPRSTTPIPGMQVSRHHGIFISSY
jgi:hypothetical protein